MATAADVIHALTNVHETIAKRLDDAPTGVTPGYSAALGGTVMPNGTLRYVTPGGAPISTIFLAKSASGGQSITSSAAEVPVVFDGRVYPGTVPAGFGFTLTGGIDPVSANNDGMYIVAAGVRWSSCCWRYAASRLA
jgi:hypothetical protein